MWRRGKFFACAAVSCALAGCGDGGGGGAHGGAPPSVRTLAYAPTECRENATQFSLRQELRIQRGEGAPVTVTEVTETFVQKPPVLPGACRIVGESRDGLLPVFAGGVQRLGVTPDGSTVVFEKTNRYSVIVFPRWVRTAKGSSWCELTAAACDASARRAEIRSLGSRSTHQHPLAYESALTKRGSWRLALMGERWSSPIGGPVPLTRMRFRSSRWMLRPGHGRK